MQLERDLTDRLPEVFRPQWDDLDGSVDASAGATAALITQYQERAAEYGAEAVAASEDIYGVPLEDRTPDIVPLAFAGVTHGTTYDMGDGGMPNEYVVHHSSDIMKRGIMAGLGRELVMEAGFTYMRTMAASLTADAARNAGMTKAGTSTVLTDYVRAVQPGACSRCIILAGKETNEVTFRRHPQCRCYAMPVPAIDDGSIGVDPKAYFDALSPEEQNKRFTKAGAEAIREGANMGRVVSARAGADGIAWNSHGAGKDRARGARMQKRIIGTRKDGTPIEVYATWALTSRRGRKLYRYEAGKRLMPESIMARANGDKAEFRRLLRYYGYMI